MIIEIPGVGNVEFPDDMPPDAIKQALGKYRTGGAAQPDAAPKSLFQKVKENVIGDDDPTTQNFGEKLGTFLNKAGESATFGLVGDETSAALESLAPGVDYATRRDHYRNQENLLEQSNPGAALGADVGGAVLGALAPGGAIGTLGKGAGLMPRIAASAGAGAGMGATYGFTEGEGLEDRLNQGQTGAVLGGIVGGAAPVLGAGVQKLANSRASKKAINQAVAGAPTSDELRKLGRAAYGEIDNAGVSVRPDVVKNKTAEIAAMLKSEGADKILTPNANRLTKVLGETADGMNTVPFSELDRVRRIAGNAAGANPANRPDTRLATKALEEVDSFVKNLGPDDVDAGDIETLQTMLPKARDIWARMSRSQLLDDAIEAGENNYRTGSASGIRAQFQRILNNKKLNRGFSEAEIKMMRRVANGTLPEQLLNYAGSGLGMMAQTAVGGLMGGIPGMAAGAALGAGSRKLSEKLVGRNAEIARALVASGKVPNLPVASDSARSVIEALLRRGASVAPQ